MLVGAVNTTFVDNMAALYRRDPRLAHAIDLLPADAGLTIEPSRAGPPTAQATLPDGRTVYLHSRHDPVAEATRLCAVSDDDQALCAVLCGLGLGYHVRPLLDDVGGQGFVLVGEPDFVTIKSALEHTRLDDAIADGRLVFLTSLDKHELHEKLTPRATVLMMGTRFVVPPTARTINAEFHARCRQEITHFAGFSKMSLVTLVANSQVTARNIARNLPAYLVTPTLAPLRDRYRGSPAVIVSAGPSLQRNMGALKGLESRAVLIAVQTTLKPLRAAGVSPHFVTTLDFSDLSKRFFEGVEDFGDAVLVAEPKASEAVVDEFRGRRGRDARPVVFLQNDFAQRCVGAELAARPGLRAGSTVAHLSFYLAEHLGCDPIIFVGQDLGFTGGVYYVPGVTIHDAWRPELGRFCSLEHKEWERIVRHRPILRRLNDIAGRPIYTDDQMFTYLEQFERDFAQCPARVIDATEGGVRKAGAATMPLAEAIAQFCTRPLPLQPADVVRRVPLADRSRLRAGREMVARRRQQLEEFRRLCEETHGLLDALGNLVDRPAEFNRMIVRIDELRIRVREHDLIYRMVCDVSQLAELQKLFADRQLSGVEDRAERTRRQLERDRRFVGSLLEGATALADIFDSSLERFDLELAAFGAAEPGP